MAGRKVQAGYAVPVALVDSDELSTALVVNLAANSEIVVERAGIDEDDAPAVASAYTASVDKRGYSAVGWYIPDSFTGAEKVRLEVSYDDSVWFPVRRDGDYLEEALVTAEECALSFYDVLAFPYARLVFLDDSNVLQVQTNLPVKYSLVR